MSLKGDKMKKKIKELTIEETINICDKQNDCYSCPLVKICDRFPYLMKRMPEMEKEIDL